MSESEQGRTLPAVRCNWKRVIGVLGLGVAVGATLSLTFDPWAVGAAGYSVLVVAFVIDLQTKPEGGSE